MLKACCHEWAVLEVERVARAYCPNPLTVSKNSKHHWVSDNAGKTVTLKLLSASMLCRSNLGVHSTKNEMWLEPFIRPSGAMQK